MDGPSTAKDERQRNERKESECLTYSVCAVHAESSNRVNEWITPALSFLLIIIIIIITGIIVSKAMTRLDQARRAYCFPIPVLRTYFARLGAGAGAGAGAK